MATILEEKKPNAARHLSVGVIGGGVAGLTCARKLQLDGVRVKVFERRKKGFNGYAKEAINGAFARSLNGEATLKALGYGPALIPKLDRWKCFKSVVGKNAFLIGQTKLEGVYRKYHSSPSGVSRADILDVLSQPLVDDGLVEFGRNVTSIEQKEYHGPECDENENENKVVGAHANLVQHKTPPGWQRASREGEGEGKCEEKMNGGGFSSDSKGVAWATAGAESEKPRRRGGVTIHFDDGSSETFDVVVGADGLNSITSRTVIGKSREGAFARLGSFYGTIHGCPKFDSEYIKPGVAIQMTVGDLVCHSYAGGNAEYGESVRYWHLEHKTDVDLSDKSNGWIQNTDYKQQIDELTKHVPDSHPIKELIRRTSKEDLVYFGLYFNPHRERSGWYKGNVALVGDAVHHTLPYLGQGANLAIEDGYVLAQCLNECAYDVGPAFKAYYDRRSPRVNRIITTSGHIGEQLFKPTWSRLYSWYTLHSQQFLIRFLENVVIKFTPVEVPIEDDSKDLFLFKKRNLRIHKVLAMSVVCSIGMLAWSFSAQKTK